MKPRVSNSKLSKNRQPKKKGEVGDIAQPHPMSLAECCLPRQNASRASPALSALLEARIAEALRDVHGFQMCALVRSADALPVACVGPEEVRELVTGGANGGSAVGGVHGVGSKGRRNLDKKKKGRRRTKEGEVPAAFLQAVEALRLAAQRFANTLDVAECPILHVKGEKSLFSVYMVRAHVLAMFSAPEDVALYLTVDLDEALRPCLEEVAAILDNQR